MLCLAFGGCSGGNDLGDDNLEKPFSVDEETSELPQVLGALSVSVEDTQFDVEVLNCSLRSIPNQVKDEGVAWILVEGVSVAANVETSQDDYNLQYELEFQLQEFEGTSVPAFLKFQNKTEITSYSGISLDGQTIPYNITVDGAPFDVVNGTNGALSPRRNAGTQSNTVAVDVSFTSPASYFKQGGSATATDTEISVSLASPCKINWLF